MQSMCSFSATTASIHLLFDANTIANYAYFRVVQLTELDSETMGPLEKRCQLPYGVKIKLPPPCVSAATVYTPYVLSMDG